MPIPEDVRDFLGDLFGRAVSVSKREADDLAGAEDSYLTGLYVDDRDRLIGACVADVAFAASAGAALAMIPLAVARETVSVGRLEDGLRDNYYEVVNIVSAMLNGPCLPHLKLTQLVDGVPPEVLALAERAAGRRHFDVTIVDYDGGKLILLGE